MAAVIHTDLTDHLPLVASGKVREIYAFGESSLLLVATDRISAFDVIMENAIDEKGAVLTQLSQFWFTNLHWMIPSLRTHYLSLGVPPQLQERLPPSLAAQLQKRTMVVQRLKVLPIESIVRGYITGSAWSSYQTDGSFCGISLPAGLRESEKFEHPLWTPSTKAEVGGTDVNISPAEAANIVGTDYAHQIESLSLQIYEKASSYAAQRGIIIADTKFEFGLDESTTPPSVVLIDEVLTPDSSRFWSAEKYEVGRGQESYDKQYLRDWLVTTGQKGKEGVEVPEDVVSKTISKYKEIYSTLTGKTWVEA